MFMSKAHLARFHLVHPPGDLGLRQHERVLLEELDVVSDALLQTLELEEVDLVNLPKRGVRRVRLLHERAQLGRAEREHATARVVEDGDLARAEQPLRDDDRPQGFLAVTSERNGEGLAVSSFSLPGLEDLRGAACVADNVGLALLDAKLCIHAVIAPSALARLSAGGRMPHFRRASMQVTIPVGRVSSEPGGCTRARTDQELLARREGEVPLVAKAGDVRLVVLSEILVCRHVRVVGWLFGACSGVLVLFSYRGSGAFLQWCSAVSVHSLVL